MKQRLLATLRITLVQFLITSVFAWAINQLGPADWARSFFIGGAFFTANILILGLTWSFIFLKKNIALAIVASVIKFSILGIILFHLVVNVKVHGVFFALGCFTFVATALIEAMLAQRSSNRTSELQKHRRSRRKIGE